MATRDTYTKVHEDWMDKPNSITPILADDLEHIESGIKEAKDNRALKEIYDDDSINLGRQNESVKGDQSIAWGDNGIASGRNARAYGFMTSVSSFN